MEESNIKELYEAIGKRMSVREYGDQIIKPEICDKIDLLETLYHTNAKNQSII